MCGTTTGLGGVGDRKPPMRSPGRPPVARREHRLRLSRLLVLVGSADPGGTACRRRQRRSARRRDGGAACRYTGAYPVEAEAGPDHAGQRQPPFADVAVPAGRELADDEWLTAADVERDTAEVAAVGACLEYRLGRTRTCTVPGLTSSPSATKQPPRSASRDRSGRSPAGRQCGRTRRRGSARARAEAPSCRDSAHP